jgi:hypothetical protein
MQGRDLINVPYTVLKTEFAAKPLTMYYIETATPHSYAIYTVSTIYGLASIIVSASDITDFEANYKPSATSVSGADEAVALKQYPEYLAVVGSLLNATNERVTLGGTQATGDVTPSPKAGLPPAPGSGKAGALVQDADGALRTRANIITTKQSIRDDFSGSAITTALTGTPSFTNGSTIVTGSGTLFTTELTRDHYIKVTAHAETAFVKVRRVISDTSLELETTYTGATVAAASVKTKWPTTTGSGGSFTIGSSLLNVLSGTTNGAISFVSRLFDFQPLFAQFNTLAITQRLSTQTTFAGFFDNVASPTQQVAIIFDGTVNTTLKFRTSFSASETQETTITLPFGLTTNLSTINYTITFDGDAATLVIDGVVVASHSVHLPDKYTKLILAWGIQNTGVPTTTTVSMDSVGARSFDLQDYEEAINQNGILTNDEIHSITGALTTTATTADQVILSYTVPTGKMACILGFFVSNNANVDGTPIKIGKNTVTTEPAAPGTVDSNIFRLFFLVRSSTGAYNAQQDFSAYPRPFGFSGDVLKMTVTPSGTGTTIWRGTLDIVLRKA